MHKILLCLTAVAVIGGCTSEWDTGKAATGIARDAASLDANGKTPAPSEGQRASDARLPNRGHLIAYDRTKPAFRRAAFTYHAVGLSEAHALDAAHAGGKVEIETPSGKPMSFAYQRHVEHGDGNWTWVGRTRDGLDAVITFGPDAVVGRIAQANTESLQLTYSNGRTWLVEADPSKLRHPGSRLALDHDVAVVPRAALDALRNQRNANAAAKGAVAANNIVAAATGPTNTIDVVLGYTPGLVAQNGGSASAVVTLLTNRIELTNQALAVSLVNPRVRLVHTLQVNYTDTTTNSSALDSLTGQTCTPTACNPITVPAELVPLRTARDQYGGDIVSLVRPLKEPEHNGCGIAWLLGPNNTTIDSTDAPFAYSVVSNGSDVRESDGFTYSCPTETLAHEMAHNMGQQHNVEDSGGDAGTHPYSYGFRETATNGFYTIMAYPLASSSQFGIAYFGNPNVNYATSRPTGSASADNARSMNQSMLLVSQFRNAVVPFSKRARNDFNGDGKSDIALWNASLSYLGYWIMNGSVYTGSSGFGVNAGQEPVVAGFPAAIPQSALLTRNTSTRTLFSYIWNGSTHGINTVGGYGDGWVVVGQGDVNGDGKDDLLWRFPANGLFAYWLMDGPVYLGGQTYSPPSYYNVSAIADFNGDGKIDLLWNDTIGRNASIWLSTGNGFDARLIGNYGTTWNMVGAADVTGDGKADILLRDNANVYLAYWKMDGATYQGGSAFGLASDRQLLTTGDFDGDGIEDVVVTRAGDRSLWLWRSNGTSFTESSIGQYGAGWTVVK
ncbi:MAG: VCBS repeat-containing protein [Xanthomonadaceae bacterium]|nr:VCBS repeat-containing protein [Xanthomonadaceae bacterium]